MIAATSPIVADRSQTAASGARGWGLYFVQNQDAIRFVARGGVGKNVDFPIPATGALIVSIVADVDGDVELFVNGAPAVAAGSASLAGWTGGLSVSQLTIGGEADGSRPASMALYGLLVGDDTTQRERMEGILAWRFGFYGQLPAAHAHAAQHP